MGRIIQINISGGGVPKRAVERAALGRLGLEGDAHNDNQNHGGPTRALCLYSMEQIQSLRAEGHPIAPGSIGENLTLSGLRLSDFAPGDRLSIGGSVLIEITGYANPCKNIAPYFVGGEIARVSQKVHPGWSRLYASVIQGGLLEVGQEVLRVFEATDRNGSGRRTQADPRG
ncbi:MAG: MOSC domain-containing protein [Chloroflexia bacterium]